MPFEALLREKDFGEGASLSNFRGVPLFRRYTGAKLFDISDGKNVIFTIMEREQSLWLDWLTTQMSPIR